MSMNVFQVLCGTLLVVGSLRAEEVTMVSGPERVSLVELYTSEGCSSCPPAERWLGELRANRGLWKQFVPLAFHVDYWDGLGWEDQWSKRQFTTRQRRYAAGWGSGTVYTPGVVLNGREWRAWRGADPASAADHPKVGDLEIRATTEGEVAVLFSPAKQVPGTIIANVALLGTGIRSDVKAGENRGRELRHDFVVLEWISAPMSSGETQRASAKLTIPKERPRRLAIAAWVTTADDPSPIQAAGGWLPE